MLKVWRGRILFHRRGSVVWDASIGMSVAGGVERAIITTINQISRMRLTSASGWFISTERNP
jgi:hypothetical protein